MDIIEENEGTPLDYPAMPDGLSDAAKDIAPAAVWERLESWMSYRYGERTVEWITHGSGIFKPRLKPAELDKIERWTGGDWEEIDPAPSPVGVRVHDGIHRFTFTVGSDEIPDTVALAYRRLAEFWAETTTADAGLTSVTDGDYSFTRSATAHARAMQYSGAADLLRAYR